MSEYLFVGGPLDGQRKATDGRSIDAIERRPIVPFQDLALTIDDRPYTRRHYDLIHYEDVDGSHGFYIDSRYRQHPLRTLIDGYSKSPTALQAIEQAVLAFENGEDCKDIVYTLRRFLREQQTP